MIKTDDSSIADILTKNGVTYSVPPYQRGFDWGKTELQELIEDLKDSIATDKKLYLGSLIFDISENSATKVNDYKVVDGQQRMTTISLVLIAIRQQYKWLNEEKQAGLVQRLIDYESVIPGEVLFKLKVSENIRDIYDHIADYDWDGNFPDKIGQKSIKRQVNKVRPILDYIGQALEEYDTEGVGKFYQTLLSSYVVVINVENDEDVFAIFERTNARGLDLNIGDLLKNYIFAQGGIEKFEAEWDEIVANASGTLQRMLKYFWISRRGHTQNSELYRNLKVYASEVGIEQFVTELVNFSRFYLATQSNTKIDIRDWLNEAGFEQIGKNEDHYGKIARVFHALKLFHTAQTYPVIFSLFMLFARDEAASPKQLLNTLSAIEKYHFINNVIVGRVGHEVEKFYAKKASDFYNVAGSFNEQMDKFVSELSKMKAQKGEFVARLNAGLSYSSRNIPYIMYFFDRMNNYRAKGAQYREIFNPDSLTKVKDFNIEHVLPQSYEHKFGIDREVIDNIGNLLPFSRHSNPGFGDKPFNEKIQLLGSDPKARAGLQILEEFVETYKSVQEWDIDIIESRTEALARDAYERVWQL